MNLKSIWEFFDGKKTTIGAILMFSSVAIIQVFGYWHISPQWLQPLSDTLKFVGEAITGVGLFHKVTK